MFCSKCGAENEEGASFCKKCGNNLQEKINTPIKNENDKSIRRSKGKKMWLLLVVIIVLLILGGVGTILWQADILTEENDEDITRGYNASVTVEEVLEKEKTRKDIKSKIGGYMMESVFNKETQMFEYERIKTENLEEMNYLSYEGGKLFGIEAENIEFGFIYSDDRMSLNSISYKFSESNADEIEQKVSEKYEEYRDDEYWWSTEEYSVKIEEQDNGILVVVSFDK